MAGARPAPFAAPILLAWNETPQGETLLGIAMQGEHDDPTQRKAAPVLAVWNGQEIRIPTASPIGEGYTGDIMAGPGGGFILSAQLSGRALLWHPGDAARMQLIGEFHRAGALTGPDAEGGFMIAGEKGPARWHLRDKAQDARLADSALPRQPLGAARRLNLSALRAALTGPHRAGLLERPTTRTCAA